MPSDVTSSVPRNAMTNNNKVLLIAISTYFCMAE